MSEAIPGNAGRNDYPRMIYRADGGTRVVDTPEEENKLRADGWGQKPFPIHQQRQGVQMPALNSLDPMATMFRAVLEAVLDARGLTKKTLEELRLGAAAQELHQHERSKHHG